MSKQPRDKVFLSYSHQDNEWMQKLETILHPLISQGKIILWHDSRIGTGKKWHDEIINALETARIAVLLVSANFLASEYITKTELPILLDAAEKGECTICWILISDCLYEESGLYNFQAAHDIKHPLATLSPAEAQNTLAGIGREINRLYQETAKIPPAPGKQVNQIKILSMTASPEDVDDIFYEIEQDTMLDAFKSFDRDHVFLDMPDPVKSTLVEIQEHLEDGKHDILHITAHGGIDEQGQGILSFEDQWGKLQEVTGPELVKFLVPAPRIVILSACHSARLEPDLMPVAQALFKEGIDIVIGMKTRISHAAAIEFNVAFFKALCGKNTVKTAFEQGKEAIFQGEQKRIKKDPKLAAKKEYEVPQLLVRKKDENVTPADFSPHRIEAPDRPESHHFKGAKYLERGFIGRRQVLRGIYEAIHHREGAIVLKGPGGIGKSTLTTRAAANLRLQAYDFIVIQGETTIEQILEKIAKKAAAEKIEDADDVYGAEAEVKDKLAWFLDNFLLKRKIAIIFDNFEENQDEKAGDFHKERLKTFLWFFREALTNKESFLFFSTRYTLPGFDSPGISLEIPEFSAVEFRKILGHRKALQRLDGKSVKNLQREIGGNPRALELLDQIAYKEFREREFTWEQLKELFPELRQRIIQKKDKNDDFTPLFLDKLFSYLTGPQRQVLDVLSIYRSPVPVKAMIVHGVKMGRRDRLRLADLSLLECSDIEKESLYYVHRLTAHYLLTLMKGAIKKKYHLTAAGYFAGLKDEEGEVIYQIEARWHYLQAGEWDQAAQITFELEDYLTDHGYPQFSFELLKEFEGKTLNEKNSATVFHLMGMLFQDFGDYDAALKQYEKSLEIDEKLGDIKGVSSSLHQIGMIYQEKGDYDAALKQYETSLEIKEKLGDIKGVSSSLHQIGNVYYLKGDYDAALKQYEGSLEINEKLGDIKGVSKSLHQIGMIYQEKGDYDAALKQYETSLEIKEKIGDIQGAAVSMGQMGNLYFQKKEFETALQFFIQAFLVFAKLGSPYANQAKKLVSKTREKLPGKKFNAALKKFNLDPAQF